MQDSRDGVVRARRGYPPSMSSQPKEPPVELPEAASEEDISTADVEERLDQDPEEQPNYTDRPLVDRTSPDDT